MNSRVLALVPLKNGLRIALLAMAALLLVSSVRLHAQSASALFKHGQNAEAREDYDAAFDYYQKAYTKDSRDLRYRTAFYRVRVTASGMHLTKGEKLLESGDEQGALVEFLHAAEIDPGNEAAKQEIARVRSRQGAVPVQQESGLPEEPGKQEELDSMGGPAVLRPVTNEPLTLHMTEDAKVIYQAVGRAAGVNVLFDPEYTSKRIQVDLNNVTLLDALRIVGTLSGTFWRTVTSNTIFVAQNNRAKRTELDEQAVETFYLTNAWQQNDLNDASTAVRNVLTNAKVYPVPSQNAIVMRGTPDELLLAQKIINDLDKARPEVVVDLAVLEVSKNWERTLGISWPSSIGASLTTATSSSTSGSTTTTATNPTLYNLAHLSASNFSMNVGSATLNLLLNDSNTKVLQSPRIRATDSQKATMKIGSRIPIATGSYQTGAATAVVSSLVNTQFQYQDVGVNVEMTPTVHYNHDVTLKIKIEVTSQSGSVTISGVTEPILSQRVVDQVIRLREGEANILGGIQNRQDQQNWTGIPGLGTIPILKYLFGSKDHTIQDDQIVFVVVPHIVRTQTLDPVNLRSIDTGVGQSIELRHVSPEEQAARQTASNSARSGNAAAAPRPAPPARSTVEPLPGQSAEAAAAPALNQMREAARATPPTATPPAPPASSAATPASAPAANPPGSATSAAAPPDVSLGLVAPQAAVSLGTVFKIPVTLTGGADIASVPLQIQYEASKLSLINVDTGDLLGRDGQAVALVHRDDGPGTITMVASRPPGTAGVNGPGAVCILTFQAKATGESILAITKPAAVNTAQQQLPATGSQVTIVVR